MIVYIINGRDTSKKLDYRSYHGYLMEYVATKEVIIYWNTYQPFFINRAHHVWFNEYNSRLSIEDKYTPGFLLLQQDTKSHAHNSELLNLISRDLNLTYNPCCDTIILTHEIELPTSGKKVGLIYWIMKTLKSHI